MYYSNPSAGSFPLAPIRIPSPLNGTESHHGLVLFNLGGPRGSGIKGISQIAQAVGLEFDLLSLDPRGMITSYFCIHLPQAVPDFRNGIGIANSTPPISFSKPT